MGKTFQADTPGNEYVEWVDIASAATNAASTKVYMFQADADIVITGVTYVPTGADGIGGATSYRTLTLCDGGAAGTGTGSVASLAMTATGASYVGVDFTVTAANASIDDGDALYIYHVANTTAATVTALSAGRIGIQYRLQ